ncbi:MAG: hypothetical protein FJ271_16745 [Planctomycetes bacterium]|nr:hypothetical protein [Planctomycetota bacterium]
MAKRWMVGAILALGMLPAPSPAQVFSFGQKPQSKADSAFSNDVELPNPEFCPEHKKHPVPGPEFAPDPGITPYLPMEEEDRNAFRDYKYAGDNPSPLLFWVKGEYLNWAVKDGNIPVILATTSSAPNVVNNFGALNQSATQVLFGSGPYSYDRLQGGRITGGFSPGVFFPIEVGGFWLNKDINLFGARSNGSAASRVLTIPFQDPTRTAAPLNSTFIPLETGSSAGFPGLVSGSINVAGSFSLWGVDTNLFLPLFGTEVFFADVYAGYRHVTLDEDLQITKTLAPAAPFVRINFNGDSTGFGPGFRTITSDRFDCQNLFNGGQLGFRTGFSFGRLGLLFDSKLALGQNHQIINVAGASTLETPALALRGPSSNIGVPGGVLAVASNSGRFTHNAFSVIPELDVNVGFQLFRSTRIFAGYTLMMMTNVVRPGDQLNNIVDARQIPTNATFVPGLIGTSPGRSFVSSDFWAQGVNFGILFGF